MSNVVLTGFRAFPGVPDNPTQALVEHFRRHPQLLPAGTALHLLDVDYRTAGAQIDALLAGNPAALVLTGYSWQATSITLEGRATGICAPDKPDARGFVPPAGEVARTMHTGIDLGELHDHLVQQGYPAVISRDAGQYLCNFSYRHALARAAAHGLGTQTLFVHLPALEDTPLARDATGTLPFAVMAGGLAAIVAALSR